MDSSIWSIFPQHPLKKFWIWLIWGTLHSSTYFLISHSHGVLVFSSFFPFFFSFFFSFYFLAWACIALVLCSLGSQTALDLGSRPAGTQPGLACDLCSWPAGVHGLGSWLAGMRGLGSWLVWASCSFVVESALIMHEFEF